ncbi:fad binding domain-containing protein [Rutstroemia sp. NJR-2017a BBW]|nr:fad binding domain-containing protein [Rutstroemia sp. NJR-2017a BBW]
MTSESSLFRVMIIGAVLKDRLGYLQLRYSNESANIPYTIFEQDSSLMQRPRDWNFGIYWAQTRLDECLTEKLKALLYTVQTESGRAVLRILSPKYTPNAESILPVINGETGSLMKNIPAPWSLRLRRKKWLELLSQDLDIRWGKRLQGITHNEKSVTLTFEDGTQEAGCLLIGAEGAHSLTREYLLGKDEAQLIDSDVVVTVALTTLNKEASLALRKMHRRYCIVVHPNGMFVWASIHDSTSEDPAQWTWMLMQTWRSSEPTNLQGTAILAEMREKGKDFASPFREVFAGIPEGASVWHNRLSYWPTKKWDNRGGKITLVGDAAHPMTFHRGQGLGNAIADAASFQQYVREMKQYTAEELAEAVMKYEEELWPRGNEAVIASKENTNMIHDWESLWKSPLFVEGLTKDEKKD